MIYLRGISLKTKRWIKKKGSCPVGDFYAGGAEPWSSISGDFSGCGN